MEIVMFILFCLLTLWLASLMKRLDDLKIKMMRSDAIIERCRMTIHNADYLTPAERLEVLNGIEAYQEDVK